MTSNETPRKVLLHVGWPKTGTTSMQLHGLNAVHGFRYLGKVPFKPITVRPFFELVHLTAYSNELHYRAMQTHVHSNLRELEISLFGNVDRSVPLIISDEGFLSTLLKPADHQYHGYSTASLDLIIDRLSDLQQRWNMCFEILISEREPLELLHAYYSQLYHLFRKFSGLGSFKSYIKTGTSKNPLTDLGFDYLRPGIVPDAFRTRFGDDHVFTISMRELFSPGMIHLSRWHPQLPDVPLRDADIENKRTLSKDVKLAHLRPIWEAKKPFHAPTFLREMRSIYLMRHADHSKLEIPIRMDEDDRRRFNDFYQQQ